MNIKIKKNLTIFIISNLVFISFLVILPISREFLFSYFIKDDLLFIYLVNISHQYDNMKNQIYFDISYILLKNNILNLSKKYLNSIDIDKITDKEKALLLNYQGYLEFKNNNLINSKNNLIEACKIDPKNKIIIHNLNYILSIIEKEKTNDNSSPTNSNLSEIIEQQNLNNLQNAENQLLKSKIEKYKNSKNERYW